MKAREKILALVVGGGVGVVLLGFVVRAVVVTPLRERDKKIAAARGHLEKIRAERREYFTAEDVVRGFTQTTYSTNTDQALAKSGEMLTRLVLQSGLRETDFSRSPFGPRRLHPALKTFEIGWSVQGDGRLSDVVDLLFLAQESPYLHRVEGLNLMPGDAPGMVRVRFRYLTLVVDPAPPVDFAELEHQFSLYSPQRKAYNELVTRDLLRPYIKRPPPPGSTPATHGSSPGGTTPPGPESFRIVSLSEWGGQSEIHVRDLVNQKTLRYVPGDSLAGGVIALVDDRTLPRAGDPTLKSFSRVIIKIGQEYWALELGKTLADKYRLAPEQLPEALARK